LILARSFKAGKETAYISSRVATIDLARSTVATRLGIYPTAYPALKDRAKINCRYATENRIANTRF
jgi:hypothetical protein